MSYTAKRVILIFMAWGLLVFAGLQVRANVEDGEQAVAPPTPTVVLDEETQLQQTLDANPTDLAAMIRLARILYDRQDYEGASLLYGRAVQLEPHSPDLLLQLAATQFDQNQFAAAQATLSEAVSLAPERPEIHLLLGLALSRLSPPDPVGATREWREVLRLAPGTDLATQAQELIDSLTATPVGR